jgi:hypothetical protein
VHEHNENPTLIVQGGQGFGLGRPAADGALDRVPNLLGPPVELSAV